jgi:hypothetical protein
MVHQKVYVILFFHDRRSLTVPFFKTGLFGQHFQVGDSLCAQIFKCALRVVVGPARVGGLDLSLGRYVSEQLAAYDGSGFFFAALEVRIYPIPDGESDDIFFLQL